MSGPGDVPRNEGKYFIDSNAAAEIARLMYQDRLTTKQMGGVLCEYTSEKIAAMEYVLDLACGPGGWVLDLAYEYQKTQVIGVDISEGSVAYGQSQAQAQGLDNARFQIMDILQPLDFPDNSFDLINARMLYGLMPDHAWVPLAQECRRILRPGGILRFTEVSNGMSSSPGYNRLNERVTQALHLTGQSFLSSGRTTDLAAMFSSFLLDAGYVSLGKQVVPIDVSAHAEGHEQFLQNFKVLYRLLQPFMLRTGVVTTEEFEQLYVQALAEIESNTFQALNFIHTVWGEKP